MFKLLLALTGLIYLQTSSAQTDLESFQHINDTVVARYNRKDFAAIYQMGDTTYQRLNSIGEIKGDLGNKQKNFGTVLSSELIGDMGNIKHFKWRCEKGNLRFEIWLDNGAVHRFKFNALIEQPNALNTPRLNDNPLQTRLDSVVDIYARIYMSDPKAVGFAIGIFRDGKEYLYHYGEIEKGSNKPVNDQTIFTIGSISKPFTGVMLSQAILEGKLHYDDDIRKYLTGDFPNLEYKGQAVTLKTLVNHTSGIDRFRYNMTPPSYEAFTPQQWINYFDTYTIDSVYRDLHILKVDTTPGVKYRYSLIGQNLIAMALEKVYHKPFEELAKDFYSKQFGMTQTNLSTPDRDLPGYALGYDGEGNVEPRMPHYSPSMFSYHTTTRDMMKFVKANVEEKNPAIKFSHQLTWGDKRTLALGAAWDMNYYYDKYRMLWHSGYDYGTITLITAYPELKIGMFLWANDDTRQNYLYDIERAIRETLIYWDTKKK
jgi:CubicO group peptidase (beta-lactamase class C family)